jgi:hypothetical protein
MKPLIKAPKATPIELLNLAARLETMSNSFEKYGMTFNMLHGAASNLRSAIGHAMLEIQQEVTVIEPPGAWAVTDENRDDSDGHR